MDRSYLRA